MVRRSNVDREVERATGTTTISGCNWERTPGESTDQDIMAVAICAIAVVWLRPVAKQLSITIG